MKTKSMFFKILKYFLLTMILPCVTVIFLCGYAEKSIKDQVISSNKRTLGQFFSLVDNAMEDITHRCLEISVDDVCNDYIRAYVQNPREAEYMTIHVYKKLGEFADNKLSDVLVYFPIADRIISGVNGSLPTEDYLASVYGREGYLRENYQTLLECDSRQPRIGSFSDTKGQTYLCISMLRTSMGFPERDYIVSVVISPQFLSSLMIQEQLGEDGTLVIFDAQKQFLLSGNGSENYDISSYDGSNAYMELENGAGGVVLQAVESQIIRCYYAFAMDKDAFWAEVSSLRLVGLITCVLCIALTVILVFRSSRQVYIPIGRAVRRVEQMGVESYDRMQHNEIEFIELMMEKSSSEKLELQRQAKIGKNLQTDQFIHALLAGKLDLHKPDQEILAQAGFPACSDFWCAVLIFVKKRVDMDITTQDFVIQNVFEEVANEHNYGYLVDLEANQYALLLNLTKNVDAEEGMAKLCECQENIRQLGLELVVASGRVHKGLKNVHLSYEEAELAMKYKYLLDDASYIHYEDIRNREFSYTSSMESNLSRDVVYFINGKNPETSGEEFVSGIMDMCDINGASSMDNIECFKYEIFSIINKAFMICGIPESGKDRIAELMIQPTLKDFRIKLAELMELLRDMKKNGSKLENTCLKAMQYIQEKYWDPQLSLTQMGVELNISPYYLSKLFKERYEISISDFLAKVRIQMAKEQLRSTDHSIRMIAEECGFLSSNVFIRVFKKWEGITPGAYREQEAERAKETADEVKA